MKHEKKNVPILIDIDLSEYKVSGIKIHDSFLLIFNQSWCTWAFSKSSNALQSVNMANVILSFNANIILLSTQTNQNTRIFASKQHFVPVFVKNRRKIHSLILIIFNSWAQTYLISLKQKHCKVYFLLVLSHRYLLFNEETFCRLHWRCAFSLISFVRHSLFSIGSNPSNFPYGGKMVILDGIGHLILFCRTLKHNFSVNIKQQSRFLLIVLKRYVYVLFHPIRCIFRFSLDP